MIRVQFWGTRGSVAAPGRDTERYGGNTACVQIIGFKAGLPGAVMADENARLIIDGGTGLELLQESLARGPLGRGRGELHILLSHYHWDHIIGLPFFNPMFFKGNRIIFYGMELADLKSSVERLFTSTYSPHNGVQNLAADIEYRRIEPAGMDVAGFHVRAAPNRHPTRTLSFRVEYGADAVVYSSDHETGDPALDAGLVSLARGANLWILDAQFTPEQRAHRQNYGHSSYRDSLQLAAEAGVEQAVLFHHDPNHNDATLDEIGRAAAPIAAQTGLEATMARDGLVIDLGEH